MAINWRLAIRHIEGTSMLPSLKPDQIVLGIRTCNIKVGDVVIVRYSNKDIIKRVAEIEGDNFYIVGDNLQASTDSRTFGWVDREDVTHKIILPRI